MARERQPRTTPGRTTPRRTPRAVPIPLALLALAALALLAAACGDPAPEDVDLSGDDATAEALREVALATSEALRGLEQAPAPTSPPRQDADDDREAPGALPEGAELLVQAEEAGLERPLFVAFLAEDCEPCAEAERSFQAVSADYLDRVDALVVNLEDEGAEALRRRYAVREIPSFVILGTDGRPAASFTAWPGDEEVAGYLDGVLVMDGGGDDADE